MHSMELHTSYNRQWYNYGKVQKRSSVDTYVQTLDRPVAEAYKLFLSFSDVVTG